MPRLLCALVALAFLAPLAQAQAGEVRRVVLTDGTVLVGVVADEAADPVVVTASNGVEQRVPRDRVARIEPLVDGRLFRLDPTRTRTVIAPTGRTLGRGRARVGTLIYIVPNATVGVSDRVDVSGTAFVSFGDGVDLFPVLGAKLGLVDTGELAVAVGTNVGFALGVDTDGSFVATPYLAATFGGPVRSASVSATGLVGASLGAGDVVAADGVLVALGLEQQLNNGLKILLDVGVPVAEGAEAAAVLPGVRFFGDRYSVDVFGGIGVSEGEVGGFAPFANFTFTF